MRIFVAGATGAVGRQLVPQLVAAGHQVTATTRSPGRLAGLRAAGAEAVVVDGLDAMAVGEAVATAGPEAVARAVGARPPIRIPVWLGRLAAGEVAVSMMTQVRGSSNAKARQELGWQPAWASWRDGFAHGLADTQTAAGPAGPK